MAAKMDAWGPDGCEPHFEEIVAVMVKEAKLRVWMKYAPFKEHGARELVRQAIAAARKFTPAKL